MRAHRDRLAFQIVIGEIISIGDPDQNRTRDPRVLLSRVLTLSGRIVENRNTERTKDNLRRCEEMEKRHETRGECESGKPGAR